MNTSEAGTLALGAGIALGFVGAVTGASALLLVAAGALVVGGAVATAGSSAESPPPGSDEGETGLPGPEEPLQTNPTGPGTPGFNPSVDAIIRSALAYAQHYGYTISDRGSWHSPILMTVDPMGAVVLHSTYQTCTWSNMCDYPDKASKVLGVSPTWVNAFHDGFKKDSWDDLLPDVYAYGLAYRQEFVGTGA